MRLRFACLEMSLDEDEMSLKNIKDEKAMTKNDEDDVDDKNDKNPPNV